MSSFPKGNFTIVNDETGRAVRVLLADTHESIDRKLGNEYLQYTTGRPTLVLGEADTTPVTVWWHSTLEDPVKRRPFNQIVSHAVGKYQNIGNHCVWMYPNSSNEARNRDTTKKAFEGRLQGMPEDVRGRLASLIPAEWATHQAGIRARMVKTDEFQRAEEARAAADAELEAWAAEDNPPSAQDLALLHAYRVGIGDGAIPHSWEEAEFKSMPEQIREGWLSSFSPEKRKALREGLDEQMQKALERLRKDPRAAEVAKRAEKLLPDVEERRAAAALARVPQEDLYAWHKNCAFRQAHGSNSEVPFMDQVDAYLEAAAKEGITAPVIASDSTTGMYGCGAEGGGNSGWTYDGTYIYAANSEAIPAEHTYWTDVNGYLVGRPKGGPGQTWSLTQWKP